MTVIMPFETLYRETVEKIFEEDLPGFSEAKAFCLGDGKRLRPRLLIDAAEIWGADPEAAARAAVGVELLHHYLLIHDDLMDGDELRRGKLTVHTANIRRYGERMGNGIAIAAGDYLANEAMDCFAQTGQDPEKISELCRLAAEITRETVLGQLREYVPNTDWTERDLESFYAYKTAAYTFCLPWLAADILAGRNEERKRAVVQAAKELGIAYQYFDDLVEFRGEKQRKTDGGGGDLERGKITIVLRLLLDALPETEKQLLLADMRAGFVSETRCRELQSKAGELGVIRKIETLIATRAGKARKMLTGLRLDSAQSVLDVFGYLRLLSPYPTEEF